MNTTDNILLILDLDETLIHAREESLERTPDFEYETYSVYLRPGLHSFLLKASEYFDLAIWSTADDLYVDEIVERIKPNEINFQFVWGGSKCTMRRDFELDRYVSEKRLKKVKKQGFNLERTLIVDDSPEKTKDNYGNAIYIAPFEGDTSDKELQFLYEYLFKIKDVSNVRSVEKRGWKPSVATHKNSS